MVVQKHCPPRNSYAFSLKRILWHNAEKVTLFHPVRKAGTLFSTLIFNLTAIHHWGHRWLLVVLFLFIYFAFLKSFPVYVDLNIVTQKVFHSLYFHSYIWFCRLMKLFDQHFLCLTVNNLRRSGLNFLRMSATKMSALTVGKRIWAREMQEKAEVKQQQKFWLALIKLCMYCWHVYVLTKHFSWTPFN